MQIHVHWDLNRMFVVQPMMEKEMNRRIDLKLIQLLRKVIVELFLYVDRPNVLHILTDH